MLIDLDNLNIDLIMLMEDHHHPHSRYNKRVSPRTTTNGTNNNRQSSSPSSRFLIDLDTGNLLNYDEVKTMFTTDFNHNNINTIILLSSNNDFDDHEKENSDCSSNIRAESLLSSSSMFQFMLTNIHIVSASYYVSPQRRKHFAKQQRVASRNNVNNKNNRHSFTSMSRMLLPTISEYNNDDNDEIYLEVLKTPTDCRCYDLSFERVAI